MSRDRLGRLGRVRVKAQLNARSVKATGASHYLKLRDRYRLREPPPLLDEGAGLLLVGPVAAEENAEYMLWFCLGSE